MSAADKIRTVLTTEVLTPQLLSIPSRGASDDEIRGEEELVGRRFREDHIALLRTWNGIGLDIIRLYGCGEAAAESGRIVERQIHEFSDPLNMLAIGSDPSGFVYLQADDGSILVFDTDGGTTEQVAASLDDLFERVVFGPDAATFAGPDWLAELRGAGLVS